MITANFFSLGEVARNCHVLESQLRRLARNKPDLPRVRVGRVVGIAPEALAAWRQALIDAGYLREGAAAGA